MLLLRRLHFVLDSYWARRRCAQTSSSVLPRRGKRQQVHILHSYNSQITARLSQPNRDYWSVSCMQILAPLITAESRRVLSSRSKSKCFRVFIFSQFAMSVDWKGRVCGYLPRFRTCQDLRLVWLPAVCQKLR